MPKKVTFDEFLNRVKLKFKNKFKYIDLSLIDINNFNYLKPQPIKCLIHNKVVYRIPKIFLKCNTLNICDLCQKEKQKTENNIKRNKKTYISENEFLNLLYNKYKDKITINNSDIIFNKNGSVKYSAVMKFNCYIHGIFLCSPRNLFRSKYGCHKCATAATIQLNIKNGEIRRQNFILNAIKIHGNQYNYSETDISGKLKKIKIICNEHGPFYMYPSLHLRGEGCKLCNTNNIFNCERRLRYILTDNFPNEEIIYQYHGVLSKLSLDFYLPKYKIGIEYQGKQHFESVDFLEKDFRHSLEYQIELDKKKFNKCIENNITLLYFTFDKQYNDKEYFSKIYVDINELITYIKKLIEIFNNKIDNL